MAHLGTAGQTREGRKNAGGLLLAHLMEVNLNFQSFVRR
jgi:hypothetical protein